MREKNSGVPDTSFNREYRDTVGEVRSANPRIECRNVNVFYGEKHAIQDVTVDIGRNEVIALIGPSGCGKSTFIRCLNRMNDTVPGCRVEGEILMDGRPIYGEDVDVVVEDGRQMAKLAYVVGRLSLRQSYRMVKKQVGKGPQKAINAWEAPLIDCPDLMS